MPNLSLKIEVDQKKVLAALLKLEREFTPTMRKELGTQLEEVVATAQREHRFTARSGNLERSVVAEVSPSGLQGVVRLEKGIAPYGVYIHEGTGIYGRGAPIRPVRAKMLHFYYQGKEVFTKSVQGWKGDHFLINALKTHSEKIASAMQQALHDLIARAGL